MVFHQRPLLGEAGERSPYRAATRLMMAPPPPRFQKSSAASSSDDRSMVSSAAWSAGESCSSPLDSCSSASSAMNSLATEAMAMVVPLPLDTSWLVLRSSTTVEMSAPASAASAVAWRWRASRPSNAAVSWSGGASAIGTWLPCGATTVIWGTGDAGGRPYTFASQPAMTGTANMTTAVAVSNMDGPRRMVLLENSLNRDWACRAAAHPSY